MTIVVTGGGSGGHITPLLAVAHELKKQDSTVTIIYIGQKGDHLIDILAQDKNIAAVYVVRAGKFRRYHGEGMKQFLDLPTFAKNLRDAVWTIMGLWQSFWLLKRLKPDVIFIKGGFVGVPVGLSAALLHVPYITHDSDALPGLANQIIAPWAKLHTVALPKESYSYPPAKTVTVGIPLAHQYGQLTKAGIEQYRQQLGLTRQGKVLLVTGGGLGALRLNAAITACMPELLERYPDLSVIVQAGRAHEVDVRREYEETLTKEQRERVTVVGYVTNPYVYSGAADVIITRAGATSMAELAAQHKACIVVPNPLLTGGHQLRNTEVLIADKAIKVVNEAVLKQDDHALMPPLVDLLDNADLRRDLGNKLGKFARNDAAEHLSMLLLELARGKKTAL